MKYLLSVISILSMVTTPLDFAVAESGNDGQTSIQEIMARREEQRRREQESRQNWANGTASGYEASAMNTSAGNSLNPTIDMNAPSANQSAKAGQGSNSSAGQIAQMVGQALQATGSGMMGSCCGNPGGAACCAKGAMLLGMGILGMMQAGMNKSTAGQHGYVGDVTYGGSDPYGTETNGTGSPSTSDPFAPSVKDKIAELEGKGFEFNAKNGTLSMPGGKSFKLSDVTNKDAMSNIGVSADDYAANMAAAAGFEKKAIGDVEKIGAHTASQGMADGGSGGGGLGRSVSSTDGSDDLSYRQKANDPKPTVAGMMKSYNGEMIGVAGDSIFAMMARRYQQKHKEESFLPPDSSPAN
ncbi:MAG: hypothetical protein KF789_11080 [Bdellovibrionaceae bacterium]|nr:hypothetical protein [Pseudobdellovibrionaceae bacterium]